MKCDLVKVTICIGKCMHINSKTISKYKVFSSSSSSKQYSKQYWFQTKWNGVNLHSRGFNMIISHLSRLLLNLGLHVNWILIFFNCANIEHHQITLQMYFCSIVTNWNVCNGNICKSKMCAVYHSKMFSCVLSIFIVDTCNQFELLKHHISMCAIEKVLNLFIRYEIIDFDVTCFGIILHISYPKPTINEMEPNDKHNADDNSFA